MSKKPKLVLKPSMIYAMGLITLYGFGALGWGILALFAPDVDFLTLLREGKSLPIQLLHGTLFGVAAFLVVNVFMQSNLLGDLTHYIYDLAKQLTWGEIIFISFCAGVGEEILFRMGVQHFLGVWPTAFLFVLLHGYFSFTDWRVTLYGVFMTLVSAGFGFLFLRYGIVSAMFAHFLIDLIILGALKWSQRKALT